MSEGKNVKQMNKSSTDSSGLALEVLVLEVNLVCKLLSVPACLEILINLPWKSITSNRLNTS